MAEQQMLLPLPPPHPLLLPAVLPPRTPASKPLHLLLRALGSSSFGPGIRRFLKKFVEEILKDPRRIKKWLKAYLLSPSPSCPCRAAILAGRAEGGLMQLLELLLRSATVQGSLVVVATLMVLNVGRARLEDEEDEEHALLERRLPAFVRQGVRSIITRHRPPPVLLWLPYQRRESDFKEIVRIERIFKDKEHKEEGNNTEQAISSVATEIQSMVQDTEIKSEKESMKNVSLKTKCTKFEATHGKFCKEKAAHLHNFKDTGMENVYYDQVSLKRVQQLQCCLATLNIKQGYKVADAEVSLKKIKQGDKPFNVIRKSFASFLGLDDEFRRD